MSKYIDAEAFFKVINTLPYKDTSYPDASAYNGAISDVAEMLAHFPAADVQEVQHGRWIMHIDDLFPEESTMECDQCHEEQPLECDDKYCPNCGAQMSPPDEE